MNGVSDLQGNPQAYQGPFAGHTLQKTQFTGGLYGGFTKRDRWGFRLEFNLGQLQGFDSLLDNAKASSAIGRYERNLNFKSPITEVALVGDLHFIEIFRNSDRAPGRFSPYFMLGLAWFWFNPQGYTADGWVDLHPLRLEGQGFDEYPDREVYKKNAFAVPAGIGLKYDLSSRFTLRFELNKRTTFTDYIDDVHEPNWVDPNLFSKYLSPDQAALARQLYNRSTVVNPPRDTRPRGNPDENDAYWTSTIKIGFNFNRESSSSSAFGGKSGRKGAAKRLRCPNF
jgi:opacity protein-like surface antigen